MNKIKTSILIATMLPFVAAAHPGMDHHGGLVNGVVHFFSSVDHLLWLLPVIVVGGVFLRKKLLPQRHR